MLTFHAEQKERIEKAEEEERKKREKEERKLKEATRKANEAKKAFEDSSHDNSDQAPEILSELPNQVYVAIALLHPMSYIWFVLHYLVYYLTIYVHRFLCLTTSLEIQLEHIPLQTLQLNVINPAVQRVRELSVKCKSYPARKTVIAVLIYLSFKFPKAAC